MKFFNCFIPAQGQSRKMIISTVFIAGLICLTSVYFGKSLQSAATKAVFKDEPTTVEAAQNDSFLSMLINGVSGQYSPAPFDYMLFKVFYHVQPLVKSFGLSDIAYGRLYVLFFTTLSGFLIGLWAHIFNFRRNENWAVLAAQSALILLAVWAYFFTPSNFYYATLMRPYGMWNVLWFSALMVFMMTGRLNWGLWALFLMAAMTSTATLFQIFAFGVCYGLTRLLIYKEKFKNIFSSC